MVFGWCSPSSWRPLPLELESNAQRLLGEDMATVWTTMAIVLRNTVPRHVRSDTSETRSGPVPKKIARTCVERARANRNYAWKEPVPKHSALKYVGMDNDYADDSARKRRPALGWWWGWWWWCFCSPNSRTWRLMTSADYITESIHQNMKPQERSVHFRTWLMQPATCQWNWSNQSRGPWTHQAKRAFIDKRLNSITSLTLLCFAHVLFKTLAKNAQCRKASQVSWALWAVNQHQLISIELNWAQVSSIELTWLNALTIETMYFLLKFFFAVKGSLEPS